MRVFPVTWQRSAIVKNPMLYAKFTAVSSTEPELLPTEVSHHCGNREFCTFLLLWPWPWVDPITFIYELDPSGLSKVIEIAYIRQTDRQTWQMPSKLLSRRYAGGKSNVSKLCFLRSIWNRIFQLLQSCNSGVLYFQVTVDV